MDNEAFGGGIGDDGAKRGTRLQRVSWIDRIGREYVGIMPHLPGGGQLHDEMLAIGKARVKVLVSLLTADEVAELELQDEERFCDDCGIRFISFPIPDQGVSPSIPDAERIVDLILEQLRAGKRVAIHCRMGIGWSAAVVACLLASNDRSVDDAFKRISIAMGVAVPDAIEQRGWVAGFVEQWNRGRVESLTCPNCLSEKIRTVKNENLRWWQAARWFSTHVYCENCLMHFYRVRGIELLIRRGIPTYRQH
jgi:protein-tyrosine phosphatase